MLDAWQGDGRLYLEPLIHEAIDLGVRHQKLESKVKEFIAQIPVEKDGGALLFSLIASCLTRLLL